MKFNVKKLVPAKVNTVESKQKMAANIGAIRRREAVGQRALDAINAKEQRIAEQQQIANQQKERFNQQRQAAHLNSAINQLKLHFSLGNHTRLENR